MGIFLPKSHHCKKVELAIPKATSLQTPRDLIGSSFTMLQLVCDNMILKLFGTIYENVSGFTLILWPCLAEWPCSY